MVLGIEAIILLQKQYQSMIRGSQFVFLLVLGTYFIIRWVCQWPNGDYACLCVSPDSDGLACTSLHTGQSNRPVVSSSFAITFQGTLCSTAGQ